jgi:hypothetical protein
MSRQNQVREFTALLSYGSDARGTRSPGALDSRFEFLGKLVVTSTSLLSSDLQCNRVEGVVVSAGMAPDESLDVLTRASHDIPLHASCLTPFYWPGPTDSFMVRELS